MGGGGSKKKTKSIVPSSNDNNISVLTKRQTGDSEAPNLFTSPRPPKSGHHKSSPRTKKIVDNNAAPSNDGRAEMEKELENMRAELEKMRLETIKAQDEAQLANRKASIAEQKLAGSTNDTTAVLNKKEKIKLKKHLKELVTKQSTSPSGRFNEPMKLTFGSSKDALSLANVLGMSQEYAARVENDGIQMMKNEMKALESVGRLDSDPVDWFNKQKEKSNGSFEPWGSIWVLAPNEVMEHWDYVVNEKSSNKNYPNGQRDKGRPPTDLYDFMEMEQAKKSLLSKEQVIALRLYTTLVYKYINGPLRNKKLYRSYSDQPGTPRHPLSALVWNIFTGLKQLRRAVELKEGETTILWRGMKNVQVSNKFIQNGGAEQAPMSTTKNLDVALQYGTSLQGSVLFKIVAKNELEMGAELGWLSAFPQEEEVLYPPLSFLTPSKQEKIYVNTTSSSGSNDRAITIIEVSTNLSSDLGLGSNKGGTSEQQYLQNSKNAGFEVDGIICVLLNATLRNGKIVKISLGGGIIVCYDYNNKKIGYTLDQLKELVNNGEKEKQRLQKEADEKKMKFEKENKERKLLQEKEAKRRKEKEIKGQLLREKIAQSEAEAERIKKEKWDSEQPAREKAAEERAIYLKKNGKEWALILKLSKTERQNKGIVAVPKDFKSLEMAVKFAKKSKGKISTILVGKGKQMVRTRTNMRGIIEIGFPLSIIGLIGKTRIIGGFELSGKAIELKDLHIEGNSNHEMKKDRLGSCTEDCHSGIKITGIGVSVKMTNVTLTDWGMNTVMRWQNYGEAILVENGGHVAMSNCTLSNCVTGIKLGDQKYCTYFQSVEMLNCTITKCQSGIIVGQDSAVTLSGDSMKIYENIDNGIKTIDQSSVLSFIPPLNKEKCCFNNGNLPDGWYLATAPDGTTYFYNKFTQETQQERPSKKQQEEKVDNKKDEKDAIIHESSNELAQSCINWDGTGFIGSFPELLNPRTIRVPEDCPTITLAVTRANMSRGLIKTIEIGIGSFVVAPRFDYDKTYNNINIFYPMTFVGAGQDKTTVNGSVNFWNPPARKDYCGCTNLMPHSSEQAVLQDFTLQAMTSQQLHCNVGVKSQGTMLRMENVLITGFSGDGVVIKVGACLDMVNCTVTKCYTSVNVYNDGCATLSGTSTRIEGNKYGLSTYDYASTIKLIAPLTIESSTIQCNSSRIINVTNESVVLVDPTTIRVPEDCKTIQEAVWLARTKQSVHMTIQVSEGQYTPKSTVVIDFAVSIIGAGVGKTEIIGSSFAFYCGSDQQNVLKDMSLCDFYIDIVSDYQNFKDEEEDFMCQLLKIQRVVMTGSISIGGSCYTKEQV